MKPIEDNPELVNDDPYGDGWTVKMKLSDSSQLSSLLSSDSYNELIG